MKKFFKNLMPMLLLVAGLGISPNLWAAESYTFNKGTTIYIDFTDVNATDANLPKASGDVPNLDYKTGLGGKIITITFTTNATWWTDQTFIKTSKGGWEDLKFSKPNSGCNTAKLASDGKSYSWVTSEHFTPNEVIYFDASESAWKGANFNTKFNWIWDSGNGTQSLTGPVAKNTDCGTDAWIYVTKVPNNNYLGFIQLLRMNPSDGTQWNYTNNACVMDKGSNNCLYCKSDDKSSWNQWVPGWKTYVPPMKSLSIANNGTTTVSGSGSQSDPYIIAAGATIEVKATAALQVDDSNPTFKYKYSVDGDVVQDYGSGNNTYQFTAGTEAHTYAVTVRAYATYNSVDNSAIDGGNTIYFKIATYTGLTIADNGAPSMTTASSLSATEVVQGQSVTITKGTPAAGYELDEITVSGGILNGTTWTPDANNQSVTVKWKASATYSLVVAAGTGITSVGGGTKGETSSSFSCSVSAVVTDGYNNPVWSKESGTGSVTFTDQTYSHPDASATANVTGGSVNVIVNASEIIRTVAIENGTTNSSEAGVATEGTATVRALAADEKFTGWTIPSGITLTQGTTVNSTTIHFNANADALTVTANIAKKTLVKLYFANYAEWPIVKAYAYDNSGNTTKTYPGIPTTEETINCVTYKVFSYYKEDNDWTKVIFNNGQNDDNCKTEDLTIAGNEGHFYMPNGWKQEPYGVLTGAWQAEPYATLWAFHVKKDGADHGQDYLVSCDNNQTTASLEANTHYVFKAHNYVTGKWYGNNNGDSYIRNSIENWDFYSENTGDCNMQTTEAGTYTFAISQFVNSSQIKVSVTYPAAQTFAVTISTDDNGSVEPNGEQQVDAFIGITVTATPNPGYHFAGWDKSTGITVTSETATTTVKASQTGTLQATFAKNTPLYFKNCIKDKWNPEHMYVYLYKDNTYWEGTGDDKQDRGTGSNKSKYEGSCILGPIEMTRIPNTDIWEYDYDPALSFTTVVFSEQNMPNWEWFANCTAVRRADFNRCMNMFVLNDATEEWHNESARYLNKGFWKSYDAESAKLYIHMDDQLDHELDHKEGAIEYSTTYALSPSPDAGTEYFNYYFYIGACNGADYSVEGGTLTPEHNSITLYKFDKNPKVEYKQVTLKANVHGDYKFTVIHNDDNTLTLTVDYPFGVNDYRVVSENAGQEHWNGFVYKKKNGATNMASFYVANGYKVKLQYISNMQGTTVTWSDVSPEVSVNISGLDKGGVYDFEFNQSESGVVSLTKQDAYKGTYYIRTDGVDGGWSGYLMNKDNEMYNYGSMLDAGVTYDNFQFDFYKAKWIKQDWNVKFCIANDYSKDLTGYFESDNILDATQLTKQTLPQNANVRFMWNSENNTLKRAYISGSTNLSDRFLVLEGDEKMFDKDGLALDIDGLKPNEINFDDKNNWVYQADIKAQANCAVKLTAAYNGTVQYFIGAAGEGEGARRTIITSSKGDDPTQYAMRAVYDFKTNRLVAGWMPDGTPITTEIKLGGDMLLVRDHQEDVKQITFGSSEGKVTDIKHVYSVLSIKKDVMLGQTDDYTTPATNSDYERTMYWISFPFEVKISEVFGVDGYGTKWIMQRYNGEKRAEIGWFKGDGTVSFWEYLAPTATLQPYKGYLLILNANYFNTEKADVWGNSATEANFYFPSTSGEIGIVQADNFEQVVPEHACGIDRTFDADDTHKGLNHKNTDSHWNVIGVPAFQDKTMAIGSETTTEMRAIYEWVPATNTYTAQAVSKNFKFQTMYAYMVQFGGTITWEDVSVVAKKAPYAYADDKNYMIELFFNGNGAEDHTYVKLADGAHTDFELNEDMMKIDNAGFPNIYSFAGNYNVAYNETKMENQTVMLGVSAPKNGSYTFAMPKDFSGKAVLVDLESGEATDLNLSDYTVELNKGTYNNRFQLLLEVEAKAPTNINPTKGEWSEDGKTKKLFINDNIYLINGGRVYNVLGARP